MAIGATHRMTSEVRKHSGRIVYTCTICDRCVEVDMHKGGFKVLVRGDQQARHEGGVFAGFEAEVQQTREPPRTLH